MTGAISLYEIDMLSLCFVRFPWCISTAPTDVIVVYQYHSYCNNGWCLCPPTTLVLIPKKNSILKTLFCVAAPLLCAVLVCHMYLYCICLYRNYDTKMLPTSWVCHHGWFAKNRLNKSSWITCIARYCYILILLIYVAAGSQVFSLFVS